MSYVPPTSEQRVNMDQALALISSDLNKLSNGLANPVQQFGDWLFGNESSDRAAVGAYKEWNTQYIDLGNRQYGLVVSGEESLEQFFNFAKDLHNAISSTDPSDWAWDTVVSQTYDATKTTVVEGAKKAAEVGAGLSVVILVAAVAYILFTFRRA